jgi:CO/xanthine dehydrogenase Mo-binding subunit
MASDAPILHPDYNSYTGVRRPLPEPSNAYNRTEFVRGDIDKGFEEADRIFEHTYYLQRQHHAYMEPQAVTVWADDGSGRTQIWTCNKVPYLLRDALTVTFGVPKEQLLFHHTYIGGDFGGKSAPASLPIAYFLSKATGRPIRMVHDYLEEFLAANPRSAMVYRLRTGVKRDGTITAHHIEQFVNSGAYAGYKPGGAIAGGQGAAGPYRMGAVRIDAVNVYTNTVGTQIMRAPGDPQAVFAIECHLDEIARGLGIDPIEMRLKNLVDDGEETATGEVLHGMHVKEALRRAAEESGYYTPKPAHVGRGVAIGDRASGGGQYHCGLDFRPDGSIVLGTAVFDQGTATYTNLAMVVAEEINVPFGDIEIDVWDTDAVPFDAGVAGSRQTRLSTIVAHEAAQSLRREIIGFVARKMDWPEESLSFHGDEIWRTDIEEKVNWKELLRGSGETLHAEAHIDESQPIHIRSFAAQIAEVSVDPDTGEVKLLKFTTAHDTGTIINPVGHQGQINGGVMQGIGYALMEELLVEDGRVTSLSFGDYKIPTSRDIPELKTILLQSDVGIGPYAIRGIGELPCIPVAPAIANAVEDASGVRIRDLPITAEKVYRALRR